MFIDDGLGADAVHLAENAGHHIVDVAVFIQRRGIHITQVDDGLRHVLSQPNQAIDGIGHEAGIVQLPHLVGDSPVPDRPQGVAGFGNLIADAVHKHAGMVEVLLHNGFYVFFPVIGKFLCIVEGALGRIPGVEGFLQHQHAQSVAGLQQRAGRRVVGNADGVEPCRLTQLHPARLGAGKGCCTQHTIVMVVACAPQQHALAVEPQAVDRVNAQFPDAEALCRLVELPPVL